MQKRVFNTKNIEVLWKHQTREVTGDQVVTGLELYKNRGEAGEEQYRTRETRAGNKNRKMKRRRRTRNERRGQEEDMKEERQKGAIR